MNTPTQAPPNLQDSRKPYLVYVIAMVAAVGGFLFGYDLSIISGVMVILKSEFALNADQQGLATSIALLGCMIGPILGGVLSDRLGRKRTLIIAGLLFAVGSLGTALPSSILKFNLIVFSFYRFVGGVGVGLASVVSPMFIAEISPASIRGKLVTINQLAVVVGFMCSVIIAYFLSFGEYWRVMLASNALPVPFLIGGLLLVPESPRWLVLKNRIAEALDVLTLIDGRWNAEREMIDIANSAKTNAPWRELFQPGMRFALMIACTLAILQQITGVSILLMYTPIIFQKAGFLSVSSAIYQNVLVSVWMVFCTVLAMLVVDRVGRKPLLLGGTALMTAGLLLMGLFFQLQMGGFYIVLTMFLCVGAYVMSLAPLAWLIMAEIFPNHLRDKAMTLASVCVWIASFLTAMCFPPLVQYFENKFGTPAVAFWIFAGVSALAFLFSGVIVPETKGRTLEELGASWTKNSNP